MKKNTLSLLLCIMLFLCGCDNNADQDIDQFTLSERCDLAPVAGPCEALIYKYYYDKTEKKCKEFLWGGCDGVVPFETMEECQQCVTKSPKKNWNLMKNTLSLLLCTMLLLCGCDNDEDQPALSDRCNLAPVSGPCYAMMPRYYYDKTEKKCKEFIWGGCGGVVPFETMEACKQCETAK